MTGHFETESSTESLNDSPPQLYIYRSNETVDDKETQTKIKTGKFTSFTWIRVMDTYPISRGQIIFYVPKYLATEWLQFFNPI